MADEQDDKEQWKDTAPPAGWQSTGAPPGAPGGRPTEAQQATALGPSTMAASHAQTMAPLTPDDQGYMPGSLSHAMSHGYQEAAEEPESQVKGGELAGYAGLAGGVGGGARMIAEKGLRAAAVPIIRGLGGSITGGAAGHYLGGKVAGPTGAKVLGTLGAVGGGLYYGAGLNEPTPIPEPEGPLGSITLPPELQPTRATSLAPSAPYEGGPAPIGPSSQPMPIVRTRAELAAVKPPFGSPENPGLMSKIPTGPNSMPKIAPVLGSPENPGLMSKIPTGPNSMPEIPVSKVSTSPGPYRGPSSVNPPFEVPASSSIRPKTSIAPGPALPPGGLPVEGGGPKLFESGAGAREPGRVGNEGSAARFTNESAYEKAGKGSREAIMTLGRRGIEPPPNSRYIMGDVDTDRVVYNPKEVTRFGPSGEPLRNMEPVETGSRARIATPNQGLTGTRINVPPTPIQFRDTTLGRMASSPEFVSPEGHQYSVTIPKDVPPEEVEMYAREKLQEQVRLHKNLGK